MTHEDEKQDNPALAALIRMVKEDSKVHLAVTREGILKQVTEKVKADLSGDEFTPEMEKAIDDEVERQMDAVVLKIIQDCVAQFWVQGTIRSDS